MMLATCAFVYALKLSVGKNNVNDNTAVKKIGSLTKVVSVFGIMAIVMVLVLGVICVNVILSGMSLG
ncbi:MAG: hypothetical protein WBB39_02580 [Candidatus Saccharimonadales bacterium]